MGPKRYRAPKTVWSKVKAAYLAGEGSCSVLAKKFGLSAAAVSTRCRREQWRGGKTELAKRLDAKVDVALTQKAQSMAERAAEFVQRSLAEGEVWLNRIDQAGKLLDIGDIAGLRDLIGAWKVAIEMGRRTFRLDEVPTNRSQLDLVALNAPIVMHVVEVDPEPSAPLALAESATSPTVERMTGPS